MIMENIKDFVINIDISNCHLLYDYGRQEYYERPPGGDWDLTEIRRKSEENREANQAKTSVRLMDTALARWGALEADFTDIHEELEESKDAASSEHPHLIWRSTSEIPSLPKRVMPIYKPGETVEGHVRLDLKKSMEVKNVHVTFKGAVRVLVRVHHGRGYRDAYGTHKYVDLETLVWKKSTGKESEVAHEMSLLSCEGSDPSGDHKHLPAGLSKFPFVYKIPSNAHRSCPPIIESSTDYAHILYRLKAVIDKGKRFKRGNIVCGHAIWVNRDYDISHVHDAMLPVVAEENMSTGFVRSGHVTCKATLPRHAYVRGDVIPLSLLVENTDRLDISGVTAYVKLGGTVYPQPKSPGVYRSINLKSEKVRESAIPAGSVQQVSMKLPLKFDEIDDNLLPVGALHDCPLIEIRYEVVVKLKRKGFHRSVELKIPITMGTNDSSLSKE